MPTSSSGYLNCTGNLKSKEEQRKHCGGAEVSFDLSSDQLNYLNYSFLIVKMPPIRKKENEILDPASAGKIRGISSVRSLSSFILPLIP